MELSGNQKSFFLFLSSFLKCNLVWHILKKKITRITDVFRKLRTPKNMVRSMPKKSRFRVCVEKQHGECPPTLFTFEGQPFYHIYWSLRSQYSYKKSILVICKISKLFPNTLSAAGNYSPLIEKIYRKEVRWNYLKIKKVFFNFYLHF